MLAVLFKQNLRLTYVKMKKVKKILIIGGSFQANVVYELCNHLNLTVEGFLDIKSNQRSLKFDLPVFNTFEQIDAIENYNYVSAIGHNFTRKCSLHKFRCRLSDDHFPRLIHPSAVISPSSKISPSSTIMANSYLDQNSSLGFGTLVNAGAIISHDVVLSDFSSVGPGAKIAGNVSIGRNTHIGIGATIIEERKIEKNVIIGAGATVVKDVERNSLVYGTPAKFIRSVSPLDKLI